MNCTELQELAALRGRPRRALPPSLMSLSRGPATLASLEWVAGTPEPLGQIVPLLRSQDRFGRIERRLHVLAGLLHLRPDHRHHPGAIGVRDRQR